MNEPVDQRRLSHWGSRQYTAGMPERAARDQLVGGLRFLHLRSRYLPGAASASCQGLAVSCYNLLDDVGIVILSVYSTGSLIPIESLNYRAADIASGKG